MISSTIFNIFRKGSKTYFYSSLFFPSSIREDVFVLYSFVRVVDDFVDHIPQQKKQFYAFKNEYLKAVKGTASKNIIIQGFVDLCQRKQIKKVWVDSFFDAMEADLTKKNYQTIQELEKYIYGSAEVIGLIMAKIMDLPKASYPVARKFAKTMQLCNFIRDIDEDYSLGRTYLPKTELAKFGLTKLSPDTAAKTPVKFNNFINYQINRYFKWNKQAKSGYKYLPFQFLIPIKTANDLYEWTLKEIQKDPQIVFSKKIKPSVSRIILQIGKNSLSRS